MQTLILLAAIAAGPQQAPRPPQAPTFVEPKVGLLPSIAPKVRQEQPCTDCVAGCVCISCPGGGCDVARTTKVGGQTYSCEDGVCRIVQSSSVQQTYVPQPQTTYVVPPQYVSYVRPQEFVQYAQYYQQQPIRQVIYSQQTYYQPQQKTYYQQPSQTYRQPTYYQPTQTYYQPQQTYRQPVRSVIGSIRSAASCGPRG